MKRTFIISLFIALVIHLVFLAVFLSVSDVKNFLYQHPWFLGLIAALPDIAVAVLTWLELGHSAEANGLRREANAARAEANTHLAKLEQLQHLQAIAENTKQPASWADKQAAKLQEHIGKPVAVFNRDNSSWGGMIQLIQIEDNMATLFGPAVYGGQAWSEQVSCGDIEVTKPLAGPAQIKVNNRYGRRLDLGEISRWEDRHKPAIAPAFKKGDIAFYVGYGKQGTSERRWLRVFSSADGNSFLLEASSGAAGDQITETFVGNRIEVSKRFMSRAIDLTAEGFTHSSSQNVPTFT